MPFGSHLGANLEQFWDVVAVVVAVPVAAPVAVPAAVPVAVPVAVEPFWDPKC